MAELLLLPVASTLFVNCTFALNDGGKTEKHWTKKEKTHTNLYSWKSLLQKKKVKHKENVQVN